MGFFMSAPGEKKDFEWQEGGVIGEEQYAPLGDVRAKGRSKLNKAVSADPKKRKEERDKVILSQQSKPYQPSAKKAPESDNTIVVEDSGLSEEIENSAAKKLIDAGKKIRGLDRFGNKK